jgi:hypothetical protein
MPWPTGVPKNMTPAERVERHITALVGKTLTDEQRVRLAQLVGTEGGAA